MDIGSNVIAASTTAARATAGAGWFTSDHITAGSTLILAAVTAGLAWSTRSMVRETKTDLAITRAGVRRELEPFIIAAQRPPDFGQAHLFGERPGWRMTLLSLQIENVGAGLANIRRLEVHCAGYEQHGQPSVRALLGSSRDTAIAVHFLVEDLDPNTARTTSKQVTSKIGDEVTLRVYYEGIDGRHYQDAFGWILRPAGWDMNLLDSVGHLVVADI